MLGQQSGHAAGAGAVAGAVAASAIVVAAAAAVPVGAAAAEAHGPPLLLWLLVHLTYSSPVMMLQDP